MERWKVIELLIWSQKFFSNADSVYQIQWLRKHSQESNWSTLFKSHSSSDQLIFVSANISQWTAIGKISNYDKIIFFYEGGYNRYLLFYREIKREVLSIRCSWRVLREVQTTWREWYTVFPNIVASPWYLPLPSLSFHHARTHTHTRTRCIYLTSALGISPPSPNKAPLNPLTVNILSFRLEDRNWPWAGVSWRTFVDLKWCLYRGLKSQVCFPTYFANCETEVVTLQTVQLVHKSEIVIQISQSVVSLKWLLWLMFLNIFYFNN